MAKDPEFMALLEYVWLKVDNDTTWNLIFARMLQLMDRDELKEFMKTAYSEYAGNTDFGQFLESKYRAEAEDE